MKCALLLVNIPLGETIKFIFSPGSIFINNKAHIVWLIYQPWLHDLIMEEHMDEHIEEQYGRTDT